MTAYPTGMVAFLFTDIEGSTRRWEAHQQAMWDAVERHFALLRSAISAHHGVLFKTVGDAVQAAFPTVPDAIAAAIDAQTALHHADWGNLGPLRVRMAIHVGEATPRDGDYLAPALNRLARVLATGYGDQILLTEAALAAAGLALGAEFGALDLGAHRLRDLLQAEHIYQLRGPGLAAEFPALKSLNRHIHNLPAQPTALLGRESELTAVRSLLQQDDVRLLTLTGPGGTGKSRLGIQVGAELLETFPDGVWFVPLAAITDSDLVVPAIAQPLGVRENPDEPLMKTLQAYLQPRQALLLLDNFEQVTGAAPDVAALVASCPKLKILVTSREPLRIAGEREFAVSPLSLPTARQARNLPPTDLSEFSAIRLFVERAQSVKPDFTLSEANAADIAAICLRLDGLPLAIELAAARVRVLPPAQLLTRLDQRLKLLTGGNRDLPARQQTLRAAIEWSYDLLNANDQALFARLSVFAGGCTLEAAESVCADVGNPVVDVLDGLDSLTQKSLIRQEDAGDGTPRFTMLETIREFAHEHLQGRPEEQAVRRAHADTFLALAEAVDWEAHARLEEILDGLEEDHANLLRAIDYFAELGADGFGKRIRIVGALQHFWLLRGHFSEGSRLLEDTVADSAGASPADRAKALTGAAMLAEARWELDRAGEHFEQALELHRCAGDPLGVARSLSGLGVIAQHRGKLDHARALYQEALDVWRVIGDDAGVAATLIDLGVVSYLRGDGDNAKPLLDQSLDLFTRNRDATGQATVHQWLGILDIAAGRFESATAHFGESLDRWRRLGNSPMIATDLANLGEARHLTGAFDEAKALYDEALAIFDELNDPRGHGFVRGQQGRLALDRGETASAVNLLIDAVRLRWETGDTSSAADALDALAEAISKTGDLEWAARVVMAVDLLRAETGIARPSVYDRKYTEVRDAVNGLLRFAPTDVNVAVREALMRMVATNSA
jgi:predicted ATPase/class 3 adenylate cyclase/Flp pilus assembly protein TadD